MFWRLIGKALFDLWAIFAFLFTTVLFAVMLVDGVQPQELMQCLDRAGPSLTSSSR